MTGLVFLRSKKWPVSMALIAAMGLAGCDENGDFAFPTSDAAGPAQLLPANAPNQRVQAGVDVERPDIFEVTDRGLWDGRPSLGGVWVAHPDVRDPERVVIRNTDNGREIIGALFRRERENPGPLLQVSSDAAEELGILPGAPTELTVIALRREETDVEEAEPVNPVVASLDAPVAIEAEPLDPVEPDDGNAVAAAATASAVVLPPALEAATAAVEEAAAVTTEAAADTASLASEAIATAPEAVDEAPIDVSAVLATPLPEPVVVPVEPLPAGSTAQIGVYSVEANAGADAQRIIATGIQAAVLPEEVGGRTVWRVIAGPLSDTGMIANLQSMGFVDAFVIEDEEESADE